MRTRHWVCGTIALGLSSGVFSAPISSEDWVAQEIRVSYADLDLNKSQGAETLYNRIEAAARKVCSNASTGDVLRTRQYFRSCYRTAMDNAVAAVNQPALADLHRDNGPKSRAPRG